MHPNPHSPSVEERDDGARGQPELTKLFFFPLLKYCWFLKLPEMSWLNIEIVSQSYHCQNENENRILIIRNLMVFPSKILPQSDDFFGNLGTQSMRRFRVLGSFGCWDFFALSWCDDNRSEVAGGFAYDLSSEKCFEREAAYWVNQLSGSLFLWQGGGTDFGAYGTEYESAIWQRIFKPVGLILIFRLGFDWFKDLEDQQNCVRLWDTGN